MTGTARRGWTVGALVAVLVGVGVALGVSGGWFSGSASEGAAATTGTPAKASSCGEPLKG